MDDRFFFPSAQDFFDWPHLSDALMWPNFMDPWNMNRTFRRRANNNRNQLLLQHDPQQQQQQQQQHQNNNNQSCTNCEGQMQERDNRLQGAVSPWSMLDNMIEATRVPRCDVRELDTGFQVAVDLPGMRTDDIKLEVRGQALIVSGETKRDVQEEKKDEQGNVKYRVRERGSSSFHRQLVLPKSADMDAISAECNDGVLRVNIPKKPECAPQPSRVIPISKAAAK